MKKRYSIIFGIICHVSSAIAWMSPYENKIRRFGSNFRGDADWEWTSNSNNNPQVWHQSTNVNNWQQPAGQSSNKGVTQSWPTQSKDSDIPDTWQEWSPQQPKNVKGSAHGGGEEPSEGRLEDILKGIPGEDFPNFDTIPDTDFNCEDQETRGYYGDVSAGCQVFHICQPEGRKDSFLCPVGTIFNQKYFVCDWWFNVNCSDAPSYYDINSEVYKEEEPKEVVIPQVTTAKPVIKPPPTNRGKTGGVTPAVPQRPPPGWSTKGSSSSSWGQSSSSQGSSTSTSWGKSGSWQTSEVNGDTLSGWGDGGGNGNVGRLRGYGTSSTRSKTRRGKTNGSTVKLSNIKQIKNQAWISVGSSNLQTQNKPSPRQTKFSNSGYKFLSSFGARMKPYSSRVTTVAPGIWTPRSKSQLEPVTLRRGIDKSRFSESHEGWFGNSNVPRNQKLQTNTQATSIVPTEIKGVWEQETVRKPWQHVDDDYEGDFHIDRARNSLYSKGDDEDYPDASTPARDYANRETQWESAHKIPPSDWKNVYTEVDSPEIRLLNKQPFKVRPSEVYKYERLSSAKTVSPLVPTTMPSTISKKSSTQSYEPFGRRIRSKHTT